MVVEANMSEHGMHVVQCGDLPCGTRVENTVENGSPLKSQAGEGCLDVESSGA